MLQQKQKRDLQYITSKYDLTHLRPSSQVYSITLHEQDKWLTLDSQNRRRKIFWNVQYTPKQEQALNDIKSKLIENDIYERFTDALILKHWYVSNQNINGTITRLQSLQQFINDPKITKYTQTTEKYLKKGLFYTYGYDKKFRPVVISQSKKMNYQLTIQQNMNIQYYFLLMLKGYKFTPGYAERLILICDLKDVEYGDISKLYLLKLTSRLSIFSCDLSEKIYIFNSQKLAAVWSILSSLIPQGTRKKITFIKKGQQSKLFEHISPYQLQQQYGGKLPNLTEYFPPLAPEQLLVQSKFSEISQTVYDSIMNDSNVFQEEINGSCCTSESCQIF